MDGTTASGDPYTTLSNTLKSICYYKFATGAELRAAGDDVILAGD